MSDYKEFDRHSCFDNRIFDLHRRNVSDVFEWAMWEDGKDIHSDMYNKLFGIWDGYLYNGLVQECIDYGVPKFIVIRIQSVVDIIEEFILDNKPSVY